MVDAPGYPDEANLANDSTYDFIEQSYLTYVVPSRTNVDLDKAFKDGDGEKSILELMEKRETLFFGTSSSLPSCSVRLTNVRRGQMKPLKCSSFSKCHGWKRRSCKHKWHVSSSH
jgi:hypothetical protein